MMLLPLLFALIQAAQPTAPPPAQFGKARPLRPLEPPQSWLRDGDYPPAAIRAGQSGTTRVRLMIDEKGTVVECEVLATSGSEALDEASCALMSQRAHFAPALDPSGQAVRAQWTQQLAWSLPEDQRAVPISSFAGIVRVTVPAKGPTRCNSQAFGAPAAAVAPRCAMLDPLADALRVNPSIPGAGTATLIAYVVHRVAGVPLPKAFVEPAAKTVLFRGTVAFDVDADGKQQNCRAVASQGIPILRASVCANFTLRYAAAADPSRASDRSTLAHVEATLVIATDLTLPQRAPLRR